MIIECEQCHARFEVNEARLKPGGNRLRCSQCRHVFTVTVPAAGPAAAVPPSAPSEVEPTRFAPPVPPRVEVPPPRAEPAPPSPPGHPAEAGPSLGFDLGELDLGERPSPPSGAVTEPGPSLRFDLGELGLGEEPSPPPSVPPTVTAGTPAASQAEPQITFADQLDFKAQEGWELGPADEAMTRDLKLPGKDDELVLDWTPEELAKEAESRTPWAPTPAAASQAITPGTAPPPQAETGGPGLAIETEPTEPLFQEPLPEPLVLEEERGSRLGVLVKLLLALVLVVGAGAAAYFFALPYFWPAGPAAEPGSVSIDRPSLKSSPLDTARGNRAFVIEGKAVNQYARARSFIKVKAALYGPKGEKVQEREVFAGNLLTEKELRTLPPPEVEQKLGNRAGEALANLNVPPRGSVPFMVVFFDIPPTLTEYSVQVSGSEPSTQ